MLEDQGFAGQWPTGFDPATSTSVGANLSQLQAIYGGLFLLRSDADGGNAHIVPYQAASGELSDDAKTVTIKLRPGLKFSDGTPFDAESVIWNFKRDIKSPSPSAPDWELRENRPFTSPDPLTIVIHLSEPDASALHDFPALNVNWIASPTAFGKVGEKKFKLKPVGAGPFVVVSNTLNSKLVLKRNPNFFKDGQPYLDRLTFKSVGGDQPAYQALLAGEAQAYEGMTTDPVIEQAQASPKLQVTRQPGTSPYVVQFSTFVPPFNNIKAREAVYYATNWRAINKGLFDGRYTVVQGFTTPADLYYNKTTPGYRTYNLAKAKKLVRELGGLSFQLDTLSTFTAKNIMTALQTQWENAGMDVTVKAYPLNSLIKRYNSGKWQADLSTSGAWDPASGGGISFLFGSKSPFTGVKDAQLDQLIERAQASADASTRARAYKKIATHLSDHALGVFGFAIAPASVVVNGVHGPGLTTKIPALQVNPGIIWSEVWRDQ